ncbi:hypothetical protein [Variovorax sp. KK3]|uniref:hypothetical protein n=1 Tax=Variovorax sp. KK3 TaxID=1855728 RepID=UPI00117FC58A|nr:hypothetical protein [Variovorax sp. KK3]
MILQKILKNSYRNSLPPQPLDTPTDLSVSNEPNIASELTKQLIESTHDRFACEQVLQKMAGRGITSLALKGMMMTRQHADNLVAALANTPSFLHRLTSLDLSQTSFSGGISEFLKLLPHAECLECLNLSNTGIWGLYGNQGIEDIKFGTLMPSHISIMIEGVKQCTQLRELKLDGQHNLKGKMADLINSTGRSRIVEFSFNDCELTSSDLQTIHELIARREEQGVGTGPTIIELADNPTFDKNLVVALVNVLNHNKSIRELHLPQEAFDKIDASELDISQNHTLIRLQPITSSLRMCWGLMQNLMERNKINSAQISLKQQLKDTEAYEEYINYARQLSTYYEPKISEENITEDHMREILAREQENQYFMIWKGVQTMPLGDQKAEKLLHAVMLITGNLSRGKKYSLDIRAPRSKYRHLMNQLILRDIRQQTPESVLAIAKNLGLLKEKNKKHV